MIDDPTAGDPLGVAFVVPEGGPAVVDHGDSFLGGPGDPLAAEPLDELPEVDPTAMRAVLELIASGVHRTAGDPDVVDHWRWTDDELDQIVPPLTRMANGVAFLRWLFSHSDPLIVAMVMGSYLERNLTAGRDARARREENDPHGHQQREDRTGPPVGDGARRADDGEPGEGSPWGHGVAPGEADGLRSIEG